VLLALECAEPGLILLGGVICLGGVALESRRLVEKSSSSSDTCL
jgi:hypothetical protein